MAAKPPKPPGNFLKCLLTQHNNNKNQQQQHTNNEDIDDLEGNNSEQQLITNNAATTTSTTTAINSIDCNTNSTAIAAAGNKKQNCNCSNISIMHLFHEMKQEFPTIPDTIVAQCVNENCHQRENCIQMLRNELELNPIPAQSYPAKVLHPPTNYNNNGNNTTTGLKPPLQQKPLVVQQKPPLKPIKPIRTAPLQPPPATTFQNSNNNCNSTLAKNTNTTTNKPLVGENIENIVNGDNVCTKGGEIRGDVNDDMPSKITPQYKQIASTTTTTTAPTNTVNSTTNEVNNNTNTNNVCLGIEGESIERILPRQRPTTLNLNSQLKKQQQEQRQRLNVQLQQRFQEQRNRQQQQPQPQLQPQQQQQQNPIISTTTTKPLRKAPLPPIAPKPSSNQFHINHTNANSFINDSSSLSSNHTTTSSPLSESEISVSVSLSTPSPTSPHNNNNTTIQHHHPFNTPKTQQQQHLQTKSPIVRHRSVITLQPEPPYTRDFLYTPANSTTTPSSPSLAAPPSTAIQTTATNSSSSATSSPTTSVSGSQKSFTSVNLTLRPPVSPTGANSALQPSTIDITAGPGFSGASGGGKSLHYSSTSYDARLGYQQNFQITVTDEGGIFSACRLRPKQQQQQQSQHERGLNHQQQQLQLQQQFHNNNVVALQQNIQNQIQSPNNHQHGIGGVNTSSGFGGSGGISGNISGNMCLPPQQAMDGPTQKILQCQKQKRDKLANALRDYKKRLSNVEQEINLLTGTIPTQGLSERLDEEINKLRRDCQDMLRSSNPLTQQPLQQELAIDHQPQQWQTQQQPQPFQRQRMTRPPPRPPPPRQTSLDIIQHHSQTSTPHTPPAGSLPNLNCYNTPQQQQQQQNHHNSSLAIPSYNHQQSAPLYTPQSYTDHSNFVNQEPVVDDSEEEYEEVIEQPWACSMCTFRNHPQLNICEACDNVRISGRITNLPRALSATNFTNTARGARSPAGAVTPNSGSSPNLGLLRTPAVSSNNLNSSNSGSRNGLNAANANSEHDTNLVQQQLQHFALHT